MISKECFTSQWIEDISAKLEYNDKNLIEKVIRAPVSFRNACPVRLPSDFQGWYSFDANTG